MAKAKRSYEEMITELEAILSRMEQEQLPLDELLKQYAAGVDLVAACRERLAAAEAALAATEAQ